MNYEFSPNNALAQFETVDTVNRVYIGFASEPVKNVFSQKHRGSKYGSSTETLLANLDLLQIVDPSTATVTLHLVQGMVPLDGATASFAMLATPQELQDSQWEHLVQYIGEMEKGFTRPPFLRSLYAFYYATAMQAQSRFPGELQNDKRNRYLLETYHGSLQAVLASGGLKNFESPYNFFDIVPDTVSIAVQEETLGHEIERFVIQDYQRSDYFEVDLPLKHTEPDRQNRYNRVQMLALPDPQSALFKFFARNPMNYPGEDGERSFPCTYVHNPHNRGRSSEHVISVPPSADYHLKGLSELLEEMEDRCREIQEEPERPKGDPRIGYDYNDPWYDERHAELSILDNPTDGSCLERGDVLEALWYFGSPLKHMKARHVSTSIFIPFWPGDMKTFLDEELKGSKHWESWRHEPRYLREFLPYMEKIFLETEAENKRLVAFRRLGNTQLKLAPEHLLEEGAAVDVVRGKMLEKSREILEHSTLELRTFVYEFGLGLLEIRIDVDDSDFSIFDTQWLEHCITLTPADTLLAHVLDSDSLNPLSPHKHFACTSLTGFDYEGGCLGDGRSTGGGIQMMVSDVEPIFKNLPLNTSLETRQTVIDETSKRYYYCSSTSLLNFDDTALREEHELAHVASSAIFNMVLAQRFILAESRQDIIRAEHQDRERRESLTFGGWLRGLFERASSKSRINIGEVREKIQHMTTSVWFNVVSDTDSVQQVFEKLREQMRVQQLYDEVQDRTKDLDEYIAQKQSDVQSRVFTIFTFIMSPLNLVLGFVGGMGLATFRNYDRAVPFLDVEGDLTVFTIYFIFWSVIFAVVWMIYRYKSAKE